MPRNYRPVQHEGWNNRNLESALKERAELGTSVRKLKDKYHKPIGTFHRYLKKKDKEESLLFLYEERRGRKPVLSADERAELRQVIVDLASLNFTPTSEDVRDLVRFDE